MGNRSSRHLRAQYKGSGEPLQYSQEELWRYFQRILEKGNKSTTYKFALARFLVEYARGHTDLTVEYDAIAEAFLEYYWYQERVFKIRQSFSKTPHVIRTIREKFGARTASRIRSPNMAPASIKNEAIREIKKMVFGSGTHGHVVPRFHTIRGKKRNVFYDYDDEKIILRPEALVFLHNYYTPLLKMIFLEWTLFLEKANPMMPKLSAKIARTMDDSGRAPTDKQKRVLRACEESKRCFYCDKNIESNRDVKIHYDHFIPWSFLYETETWNLVVSCQTCNTSKSDTLAPESYMKKLLARNEKYPKLVKDLGGEWKNEIKKQYNGCGDCGFERWDGAKNAVPQQRLI